MDNNLISNKELIEMGYRPHTANDIIHQARSNRVLLPIRHSFGHS